MEIKHTLSREEQEYIVNDVLLINEAFKEEPLMKIMHTLYTNYGTKQVIFSERSENLFLKIGKMAVRYFKVKVGKLMCFHSCAFCPHREQCWRETGIITDPSYTEVWNNAYEEGFANGYDQGWEESQQ